ncbi:unnamed protein product [Auanema sp. JU1783]|nr:unnamed protein product [Auanema sp. JU1783]
MKSSIAMLFVILGCSLLSTFAQNLDEYRSDVLPKYSSRTPFRHHLNEYEERPTHSDYDVGEEEDDNQEEMDFHQRPTGYPEPEIDSSRPVGRGSEHSGDSNMPHNGKAKIVGVDMHMVAGIYPESERRMADDSSKESDDHSAPTRRPHPRSRESDGEEEDFNPSGRRHFHSYPNQRLEKPTFELGNPYPKRGRKSNAEEEDSEDEEREYVPVERHHRPYPYMKRNRQEHIPRIPKEFRVPFLNERYPEESRQHKRRQPWGYREYRPFQEDSNESYERDEEEQLPKQVKPRFQGKSHRNEREDYHPRHRFFPPPRFEPFDFENFNDESDFEKKSPKKEKESTKVSASHDFDELPKSGFQNIKPQRFESDTRRRNDGANTKNRKEDISSAKNLGPKDGYSNYGQRLGNGNISANAEEKSEEELKYDDPQPMESTTNSTKLVLPTAEPLQSNSTVSNEKIKVM